MKRHLFLVILLVLAALPVLSALWFSGDAVQAEKGGSGKGRKTPTPTPTLVPTPTPAPTPTPTHTPPMKTLVVGAATASPGEAVIIPISLDSLETAIRSIQVSLAYDRARLKDPVVIRGPELPDSWLFSSFTPAHGDTMMVALDIEGISLTFSGTIFEVALTVGADAPPGDTAINVTLADLRDSQIMSVEVAVIDGHVSVIGPIHVGDLDGVSTNMGKYWQSTVAVRVHDANHNPVVGATVSGSWSGGYSGTTSCVTKGEGQCSVTSGDIRKRNGSAIFKVDQLSHAAMFYQSADNHDPDGSSDGNSIPVTKP